MDMAVSMEDIFLDDGTGGSAPQIKEKWNIHDLWANAMDENTAKGIIDNSIQGASIAREWYNATSTPYLQGINNGDERLLGKKIGTLGPGTHEEITAHVPRHGVKMFRLRCDNKDMKRYAVMKDEL